ncbi:MAG: hypothetical protein IKV35_01085 [Clostridia bacterium]|nr:hypothetical protein [Clostridia bacterium]
MKTLTQRMWRPALSMLLVLSLAVGMSVPAFAATAKADVVPAKTLKYVSLGDSMTNGYGLTNYDNNGYLTYGEEAYPNQFADWLVSAGYADEVEHTQLAMSAMRAEDLHYILEFPVDNADAFAAATAKTWNEETWNAAFSVGDYYTWDEFTTGRFRQNCTNVNEAAKMYQAAVADADIISIGSGNANFGVFLMGRMTNAIGFNGDASEDAWIDIERALAECDETTRAKVLALKAELDAAFAKKIAEMNDPELAAMAQPMYNAVTYTVVSFALNYAGSLEAILKANPDAQIMLVGIMNTMSGVDLTIEKNGVVETIPMADVLSMIVDPVNAYIASLPTMMQLVGNPTYANATFYYAEAPEVECIVETYSDLIYNSQSVVRDRFVEEIVGEKGDAMVWSMVSPMLANMGISLVPITVEDVEKHEQNPYYFLATMNYNKMYSCAVYLGFEKAIVEASENPVIPAESVMALNGNLPTLFAGVGEKLMSGNAMELANPVNLTAALTDALVDDETVMGLLYLYGRMMIGNGLGAHPSVKGHDDLSQAVIGAYAAQYTAAQETAKNLSALLAVVNGYVQDALQAEWAASYAQATTADVKLSKYTEYVVLGDDVAAANGYVDAYAARLKDTYGVNIGCTNLASDGQKITDSFAVIGANVDKIQKAGLITIDYGKNEYVYQAVARAMSAAVGAPVVQYDWDALLGTNGANAVASVLANLQRSMADNGTDAATTSMMMAMAESYAYNMATYMMALPSVVSTLREINPDAAIVIVGMYNPLKDVTLSLNGTTMAIGDYFDTVVNVVDSYNLALCMMTENATFVQAQDVVTAVTGQTIGTVQLMQYMGNKALLAPSNAGNAYIAAQIDAALTETIDINNDGTLNMLDVVMMYNVVAGKYTFAEDEGALADYNRDGTINILDVSALYRVVAGAA